MNENDFHDLWLRELAGEALSPAEREALDEAIENDARAHARRREEFWTDGTLRAMGRVERTADAFVRSTCARLRTEQDAAQFVGAVTGRVPALRSGVEFERARAGSGTVWVRRRSIRILAAAAGLLLAVGVWVNLTSNRVDDAGARGGGDAGKDAFHRPRLRLQLDPALQGARVSFDGAKGWKYWVECAARLDDSKAWQAVPGTPAVCATRDGQKLEIRIPDDDAVPVRFFRVKGIAL